jgi:hypothetical protein
MSRFLYFAYGSNMLAARLRERTPSARRVAVARLPGHALRWHKAGRDGSGKCDVVAVADAAACVHGVLHEIARAEKAQLDQAEALGVGYDEQRVQVHALDADLPRDPGATMAGDGGGWTVVSACLYVARQVDVDLLPYDWYRDLVVAGAREHALPPDYVAQLAAVPARPDPDPERALRHHGLIGGERG